MEIARQTGTLPSAASSVGVGAPSAEQPEDVAGLAASRTELVMVFVAVQAGKSTVRFLAVVDTAAGSLASGHPVVIVDSGSVRRAPIPSWLREEAFAASPSVGYIAVSAAAVPAEAVLAAVAVAAAEGSA